MMAPPGVSKKNTPPKKKHKNSHPTFYRFIFPTSWSWFASLNSGVKDVYCFGNLGRKQLGKNSFHTTLPIICTPTSFVYSLFFFGTCLFLKEKNVKKFNSNYIFIFLFFNSLVIAFKLSYDLLFSLSFVFFFQSYSFFNFLFFSFICSFVYSLI